MERINLKYYLLYKKKNLQKNIFLIGYVENIFPYISLSQGFILTSLWEDPGFVLIRGCSL